MSANDGGPSTADHVGQAAGGITGVVAGAAIGATAGPVGVLLGGIAGAIGGWWSGRAIAEAAEDISETDAAYYRDDYDRRAEPREPYEDAKAAYYLGDVAAANPDYADRSFDDIEVDLSRGWCACRSTDDEWRRVRCYASVGFEHGRERRCRPSDRHQDRARP